MTTRRDFAVELQDKVLVIELEMSRISGSRRLSRKHSEDVSTHFAAKPNSVSSNKKLYPPNQMLIKAMHSCANNARATWRRYTIAYRDGRRLLQRSLLDEFTDEMNSVNAELQALTEEADLHRDEILDECREFLGEELFDINDYPTTFIGSMTITWSVGNFRPPEDLLQLAPETYARECAKVTAMFEDTVARYEDEAREELANLVQALTDKLTEKADEGKKVIYKESAANNLREFFERFKMMQITSDETLNELVSEAESALGTTTMKSVKQSPAKRKQLAESFSEVASKLDSLVTDAPARSINFDSLED